MAEVYHRNKNHTNTHYASVAVNSKYPSYSPGTTRQIDFDRVGSKIKIKAISLSVFEKITILVTLLICVTFIVSNLYVQYNNSRLVEASNHYNFNTLQIQKQTNQMSEIITKQFNYEAIQKTVEKEQMIIDKSQIRTVE